MIESILFFGKEKAPQKKHEWEAWLALYFPLFFLSFSFLRRFSSLHRREKSGKTPHSQNAL